MVLERRLHAREDLALPLELDGKNLAMTRNISRSGLYLEIFGAFPSETLGVLEVERHAIKFIAEVELVRVDYGLSKTGVALRFASAKLKSIR